jgi:hypothetical protein
VKKRGLSRSSMQGIRSFSERGRGTVPFFSHALRCWRHANLCLIVTERFSKSRAKPFIPSWRCAPAWPPRPGLAGAVRPPGAAKQGHTIACLSNTRFADAKRRNGISLLLSLGCPSHQSLIGARVFCLIQWWPRKREASRIVLSCGTRFGFLLGRRQGFQQPCENQQLCRKTVPASFALVHFLRWLFALLVEPDGTKRMWFMPGTR